MQIIEEVVKTKKIKLKDDDLLALVRADRDEAERYYNAHIAPGVAMRYDLLHSNSEYYQKVLPKLQNYCSFSTTDVKDIIEWLMPSFDEIFFGSDKIIGIFGRTRDDNPDVIERVIQYQLKNQNNHYKIFDQWMRDALESGLGVIRMDWVNENENVLTRVACTAEEFINMDSEVAEKTVKKVEPQEDGSYILTVKNVKNVKDQVVFKNVKPGEYIYIPDKDEDDRMVFECHRRRVLYNELVKKQKQGIYRNIGDFDFYDTEDDASMRVVEQAIRNYSGEPRTENFFLDASQQDKQDARKMVMIYDCYGQYDVNNDGILEHVHVIFANNRVIFSEINEIERSPFFHISFYSKSYQDWKEGVADFLQTIQDLKTALVRQVVINTAINNDRSFAVDTSQQDAIDDLEKGKKTVRVNLTAGRGIHDVIQPLEKFDLARDTFNLLELASSWGEQKTGITKYNQGLDANSLNKTATGISKIMEASQQRMRKMARDAAENGMVPLYKHLIKLDKKYLDHEFIFRLTNKDFTFTPDDIQGDYDVMITSNIGLQDKQLTVQNLLLLFTQILPQMIQTGVASPLGMQETALQIIESMGFSQPDQFIGMNANIAALQQVGQTILQLLPSVIQQIAPAMGISPEQAVGIVNGLSQSVMGLIQQMSQTQMQLGTMPPQQQNLGQSGQQVQQMNQIQQLGATQNGVMINQYK